MNDILRALGTAAAILLPVLILSLFVSIAMVKRGAASMLHAAGGTLPELDSAARVAAAKPAPAAAAGAKAGAKAAGDEISVSTILILGTGLFVVTVLALLGLSLALHS
jgi:hypothetical protein